MKIQTGVEDPFFHCVQNKPRIILSFKVIHFIRLRHDAESHTWRNSGAFQQEFNSDILNSPCYQPVSHTHESRSCDAFDFNLWLEKFDLIQQNFRALVLVVLKLKFLMMYPESNF
jgi:hypothetical protein